MENKNIIMTRDELESIKQQKTQPKSNNQEIEDIKNVIGQLMSSQKEQANEADRDTTARALEDKIVSGKGTKLSSIMTSHPRIKEYWNQNGIMDIQDLNTSGDGNLMKDFLGFNEDVLLEDYMMDLNEDYSEDQGDEYDGELINIDKNDPMFIKYRDETLKKMSNRYVKVLDDEGNWSIKDIQDIVAITGSQKQFSEKGLEALRSLNEPLKSPRDLPRDDTYLEELKILGDNGNTEKAKKYTMYNKMFPKPDHSEAEYVYEIKKGDRDYAVKVAREFIKDINFDKPIDNLSSDDIVTLNEFEINSKKKHGANFNNTVKNMQNQLATLGSYYKLNTVVSKLTDDDLTNDLSKTLADMATYVSGEGWESFVSNGFQDRFYNTLKVKGSLGMALAAYIKDRSGVQASDKERAFLTDIFQGKYTSASQMKTVWKQFAQNFEDDMRNKFIIGANIAPLTFNDFAKSAKTIKRNNGGMDFNPEPVKYSSDKPKIGTAEYLKSKGLPSIDDLFGGK